MLSDAERDEIEAELSHLHDRRSVCIDALRIVQHHRRWVSDEALEDVAQFLGMSEADLDGVATFYNRIYRQPVGRNVIVLCDSVTCYILGQEALQAELERRLGCRLGETSADGEFTLLPTQCLGCCDRGPALMVGPDLHVEVADVDAVLAPYREA